ncbi:tRNA (adenosine(37)-N6)-threonylcarbamoyltransferase complex dimerization subunit type 1 TsaB [Methylothermus subterraneus]
MRILALETATDACSAALYCHGDVLERFVPTKRLHTQWILKLVEELLEEAGLALKDLDALAFGRGPGAFTSLRIAAGVVQGLALGAERPVVPVSSLAALAWEAFDKSLADYALAALDARMGEVYWGVYGRGEEEGQEVLAAPEEISVPAAGSCVGIGPGWQVYGEVLCRRVGKERLLAVWPEHWPRASAVARLAAEKLARGEAVRPEHALPVYLRDRVTRSVF